VINSIAAARGARRVPTLGLARDPRAHFDQGNSETKGATHRRRARLAPRHMGVRRPKAMFQAGRFGSGDIRAWRSVIEGSHLLADAVLVGRVSVSSSTPASGDKESRPDQNLPDIQRACFQSGTYLLRAVRKLLGPSNSIPVASRR